MVIKGIEAYYWLVSLSQMEKERMILQQRYKKRESNECTTHGRNPRVEDHKDRAATREPGF